MSKIVVEADEFAPPPRCGVAVIGGTDSGFCMECGELSATLVHGYCLKHMPANIGINFCKPQDCPPTK